MRGWLSVVARILVADLGERTQRNRDQGQATRSASRFVAASYR
jgi:hypothetical protein